LQLNRFLVQIDIPKEIWNLRNELNPLPGGWDALPSGITSRKSGDQWITSMESPLLVVPSVIAPDEQNVLINPLHPNSTKIKATTLKRWVFDTRFF
jgi:RES domain-containing protein